MGWFGQGQNSQKGNFVQGMQHPRIFGRGRTNIAPVDRLKIPTLEFCTSRFEETLWGMRHLGVS